ncbi:MAG: DNA mismatch repair protein MutS [Bacteroidales bacterium]|nr:DNA mismatch repair protein MutS [Bacteroidales bacterium]MBQ7062374.1 DNA mismatch repair protein MutS [Bacteroidales bacterium]
MRQYAELKKRFPDAMLLFRVGDFYETFSSDAIKASSILGITLTRKASGNVTYTELAGFPYHALEQYLPRLVRAGQRVAICEQLEDPKTAKGLVKRGITELVTPGVSYNDMVLEVKENNFLCGLHLSDKVHGVSFLDVSTGEFFVAQGDIHYIDRLLQNFAPTEVVLQRKHLRRFQELFPEKYYTNTFDDWVFTADFAQELLLKQFGTTSLKGFGVEELEMGIIASGAVLYYLQETQHDRTQHICKLTRVEEDKYVWLDKFTIRNLELIHSANENARTLIDVIDQTLTPMGARLLRRWMVMPLKEVATIEQRLSVVDQLVLNMDLSDRLRQHVRGIGDLERLISKAAVGRINPRELLQLKRSLQEIEEVKKLCGQFERPALARFGEQLNGCHEIYELIEREICEEAPVKVEKGGVIADGVDAELDELRSLAVTGKDYLSDLQQRESERTGIPSLRVGFNNVFGYYLEVTNTHKDKVPSDWVRRQTLTNAERYITPELKEYEGRILGAEERIQAIEGRLYQQLLQTLTEYVQPIQYNAQLIAQLDCLQSFASVALANNYCRPELNEGMVIDIKEGRHPVIETQLPLGEKYVSNNVHLDNENQQIIIITGPNMSGKSALLRQTALIVLLAQMGCYCPAEAATIGVVDKVFTRVGASDNISSGESTFMVEMNETASILNNVSDRSLVLLDEIGRGTSTYDGISIAWAITEYLHDNGKVRPKVLFATHYHELIEMADQYDRIENFHVSVKEVGNKVMFLRKLEPGGSEHSFGIHVARMAGMPPQVLKRAHDMLDLLESKNEKMTDKKGGKIEKNLSPRMPETGVQLSFIQLDDPTLLEIRDKILDIDIDTLTPVEALVKLNEIKKIVKKK